MIALFVSGLPSSAKFTNFLGIVRKKLKEKKFWISSLETTSKDTQVAIIKFDTLEDAKNAQAALHNHCITGKGGKTYTLNAKIKSGQKQRRGNINQNKPIPQPLTNNFERRQIYNELFNNQQNGSTSTVERDSFNNYIHEDNRETVDGAFGNYPYGDYQQMEQHTFGNYGDGNMPMNQDLYHNYGHEDNSQTNRDRLENYSEGYVPVEQETFRNYRDEMPLNHDSFDNYTHEDYRQFNQHTFEGYTEGNIQEDNYTNQNQGNYSGISIDPSEENKKLEMEIEILRKQRQIIEEERKLLMEKKKLEMIKESSTRHKPSGQLANRPVQKNSTRPKPKNKDIHITTPGIPNFFKPIDLLINQMNPVIDKLKLQSNDKQKLLNLLKSHLRKTLAVMMQHKTLVIPAYKIVHLYRKTYPKVTDESLVRSQLKIVLAAKGEIMENYGNANNSGAHQDHDVCDLEEMSKPTHKLITQMDPVIAKFKLQFKVKQKLIELLKIDLDKKLSLIMKYENKLLPAYKIVHLYRKCHPKITDENLVRMHLKTVKKDIACERYDHDEPVGTALQDDQDSDIDEDMFVDQSASDYWNDNV